MKYTYLLMAFLAMSICNGQSQLISKANELTSSIRCMSIESLIYSRGIFGSKEYDNFYESLTQDQIETLLGSKNGKIKALGIFSLYNSYDQRSIHLIAKYMSDTSKCFVLDPVSRFNPTPIWDRTDEMLSTATILTVGDISNEIIKFYCQNSGYNVYGYNDFEGWMKNRLQEQITVGYLKMLKRRATGGSTSLNELRRDKTDRLKMFINSIVNQKDRIIYKLYLSSTRFKLYSDLELIDATKKLSKEQIKKILSRIPDTQDVDLIDVNGSEYSSFYYKNMCKWILLNCADYFVITDIPFLLNRAKYERDNRKQFGTDLNFIYWYLAAARLDNKNASIYLKDAVDNFREGYQDFERAEVFAEFLHIPNLDEKEFVLDWIFNSYIVNEESKDRIDVFINRLDPKQDLEFIKYWIQDKRFEEMSAVSTIIDLSRVINSSTEENMIPEKLISSIYHPYWLQQFERDKDQAMRDYPTETLQLLEGIKRLVFELKKIN